MILNRIKKTHQNKAKIEAAKINRILIIQSK